MSIRSESCMYLSSIVFILLVMTALVGCGGMQNDLLPTGGDKRPAVQSGTVGPNVGQIAPDFTAPDTFGNPVALSSIASSPGTTGTVLYFTMWCPQCIDEMTDMQNTIMPNAPHVSFLIVDYVSGTVVAARSAQFSYGFGNSGFIVIADTDNTASSLYGGTMGTTIVIDRGGIVRMNESYKSGRLASILSTLP